MNGPECGTYAAYQRHIRRGEEPDDACRAAQREYQREYRAKTPFRAVADRRQSGAYAAALALLRERHQAEFDRLYAVELRKRPSLYAPERVS